MTAHDNVKAEPQWELVERVAELEFDMDVALSSEAPYYQGQDPTYHEVDEATRNEYRQRAKERVRDARESAAAIRAMEAHDAA